MKCALLTLIKNQYDIIVMIYEYIQIKFKYKPRLRTKLFKNSHALIRVHILESEKLVCCRAWHKIM